jgi:PTH1 family peptidyl-tRNA hydrolase
MLAVVGLGNPGIEYEMTRHNMGFLVLETLAQMCGVQFRKDARFEGWRTKADGVELLLPATYMNESGRAVQKLLRYFQIIPSKMLVVVDDMDLPFGQMRLKAFGGSGGHNGLKSLELHLGTKHFARLRIGIGRPDRATQVDYVLGGFSQEERVALPAVRKEAATYIKRLFVEDFAKVANDVNRLKQDKETV